MKAAVPCFVVLGVILTFSLSCSGPGSPVSPGERPGSLKASNDEMQGPEKLLWGLYEIFIDQNSGSVGIVPLRRAMFEANATKFLQPPASPASSLAISLQPGTDFSKGYVVANVGIQHPFPNTNLRGFDVMGIFMSASGGYTGQSDPSAKWPSLNDARLLNADGYTRWWNQAEFTSYQTLFGYTEGVKAPHGFNSTCTINPFKYYANGLGPDDPWDPQHFAMTDRGTFDTVNPGLLTRRYEIQFPATKGVDYRFKYAIAASWAPPNPGTTPPAGTDDFALSANQLEAVKITVTDAGSDVWYHSPSDYGGDIHARVSISDWQFLQGGPQSCITSVVVESPTLFSGAVEAFKGAEWWYVPDAQGTIQMMLNITNTHPITTTMQELMISVVNTPQFDYSSQPPGYDVPDEPLTAYQAWTVPVKSD
jgi:hypothetical protein